MAPVRTHQKAQMLQPARRTPPRGALRYTGATALAAILAFPSACSDAQNDVSAETSVVVVRDSAGVEIVENGRVGLWGSDPVELIESLRIGTVAGEPEYELYRVQRPVLGLGDTVFVPMSTPPEIRVFAPDGRYVRTIGREGDGPGELRRVGSVSTWGDTLLIGYSGTRRATLFRTDGELIEQFVTGGGPFSFYVEGRSDTGWALRLAGARSPGQSVDDGDWVLSHSQYARVGSIPAAVAALEGAADWPGEFEMTVNYLQRKSRRSTRAPYPNIVFRPFLAGASTAAVGVDGTIYVTSWDEYRIEVYTPRGRLERVVTRADERVPIDDELVERFRSRADEEATTPEQRARLPLVLEPLDLPVPEYLPPLRTLQVGRDGAVWVKRRDKVEDPIDLLFPPMARPTDGVPTLDVFRLPERVWDVFDGSGRFLGTVEVPPGFEPSDVGRERVLGTQTDSLGVEYVVRLDLRVEGGR